MVNFLESTSHTKFNTKFNINIKLILINKYKLILINNCIKMNERKPMVSSPKPICSSTGTSVLEHLRLKYVYFGIWLYYLKKLARGG